jgi:hypothetical protein
MNTILSFGIQVLLTLAISVLLVSYLRPFLQKVLIDLCGTEDRAQFWTAFSSILLIGTPVLIALNYRPEAVTTEGLFLEVASKLSGNLAGLLFSLIIIGLMVSLFALFAPKPKKMEAQ